jgi:hypothetical protein
MSTIEPKENQNKSLSKYVLTFLLSVIFTLNISANINIDTLSNNISVEKHKLEKELFNNLENSNTENLEINEIEVFELEEKVELDVDTSNYLPENFNALKGKNDLDWNTIEIIELEEEVELGVDPSKYLPKNFNVLKGKHDLDWSTIELIELEEDIEINFDTKSYLPEGFNAYKSMTKNSLEIVVIH